MASGNRRRDRRTIRNGRAPRKRRPVDPRPVHVRKRFLERYGFPLTLDFERKIIAEVQARRFIRDTWRPNLLQVTVHNQVYNLVWDPVINKIITFYPREDFRER